MADRAYSIKRCLLRKMGRDDSSWEWPGCHLTSLDAIITRSGVTLDTAIGRDGHGVIRIDSTGPMTIRLAEVRPKNAEAVRLIFRGHLRVDRANFTRADRTLTRALAAIFTLWAGT